MWTCHWWPTPPNRLSHFIAKHKLRAASSVSASLKKLLDNELVYQTANGYIIYDRFMGEWLRRQAF